MISWGSGENLRFAVDDLIATTNLSPSPFAFVRARYTVDATPSETSSLESFQVGSERECLVYMMTSAAIRRQHQTKWNTLKLALNFG